MFKKIYILEILNYSNLDGIRFGNINFDAIRRIEGLKAIVFRKFFYCSETPLIRKCRPITDGNYLGFND